MSFDYKNHYNKLMRELMIVLLNSMNEIPKQDKEILTRTIKEQVQEVKPVIYPVHKKKKHSIFIEL